MSNTGKVFSFTLGQLIKRKGNRVTFMVMAAIVILAVPVASIFLGGETQGTISFSSQAYTLSEYLKKGSDDFDTRYGVQYGYSILLMIINMFAGTYVVRSIIEEKTSKLVETLMVSINSKDMIFGKILAVMAFILGWVGLLASGFAISYGITSMFRDVSFVGGVLKNLGISTELLNLGPAIVIVILVSMAMAFLMFSMISSLFGAGCSSVEETDQAAMAGNFSILIGYMGAVTLSSIGKGTAMFTTLCPPFSAFAAPVNFMLGYVGWSHIIISWAIQLAGIGAIYVISGKVYDSLVFYKGKRLKFGEILRVGIRKEEK